MESSWCLQLINHSVPDDVVEGIKANIQHFFQLPAEVKKQFAQEQGQLEGYGQLFVVSEDQKLDWADMLYLYTQPPEDRNLRFWPDQPANFRYDCDSSLPLVVSLLLNLIKMK
jgi:isopenicillin N synthase-like dioxygenase